MATDMRVIQASSIPVELKAIGQLVLGSKGLGIQAVDSVVEQIGGGRLLEAVPNSGGMGFGQFQAMTMTVDRRIA